MTRTARSANTVHIATESAVAGQERVLTSGALTLVASLHRQFDPRRRELLAARAERRTRTGRTGRLDFRADTAGVREADWHVADAPADLRDRRVEFVGPTDPASTIEALTSGARAWLADLEDAGTPHWRNVVGGQVALHDAIRRTLTDDAGRTLPADGPLPAIVVRVRGWHLDERHVVVDGSPVAGALVDFGLYLHANAAELVARGSGPYFYLPKLESHVEARLWSEVFTAAERDLGLPHGTIRATVLIETVTAALEMDEILFELRDHASGLNAGRWDYLFSFVKEFRDAGPGFVLPERNALTMTVPFMRAYTDLLVATCHRRGAVAMGGLAAAVPDPHDADANARAAQKVRDDKTREAGDGFDGSWVVHRDLVPVCEEAFGAVLGDRPNQVDRLRPEVVADAAALLDVASAAGGVSEAGLRDSVGLSLRYLEAWLRGEGAIVVGGLLEDTATVEVSRAQLWQWAHNEVVLDTGVRVDAAFVGRVIDEESDRVRAEIGEPSFAAGRFADARSLLRDVSIGATLPEFLTLPGLALID